MCYYVLLSITMAPRSRQFIRPHLALFRWLYYKMVNSSCLSYKIHPLFNCSAILMKPDDVCAELRRQVNDWGWKMTVTPVMAKMNASSLPPAMLDSKMASLLRICRDCPKEQVPRKEMSARRLRKYLLMRFCL